MQAAKRRGAFTGAFTIASYNWPFYAAAILVVVLGVVLACLPSLHLALRWTAVAGAGLAGWLACASFLAAHWVFDRSELTQWLWLAQEFKTAPPRWIHINAGLEETQAPWQEIFPGTDGKVLDIYDPAAMTEPAIARARQQKSVASGVPARVDALPIADGWADAVFLLMTAHEIRAPEEREQFFRELARVLSARGRVVVVEHLRDWANATAFGPGVFHFLPRREWLRLASVAGLKIESERSFTPFVRVLVYSHFNSITQQPVGARITPAQANPSS